MVQKTIVAPTLALSVSTINTRTGSLRVAGDKGAGRLGFQWGFTTLFTDLAVERT